MLVTFEMRNIARVIEKAEVSLNQISSFRLQLEPEGLNAPWSL
jgi:hypothetical protein